MDLPVFNPSLSLYPFLSLQPPFLYTPLSRSLSLFSNLEGLLTLDVVWLHCWLFQCSPITRQGKMSSSHVALVYGWCALKNSMAGCTFFRTAWQLMQFNEMSVLHSDKVQQYNPLCYNSGWCGLPSICVSHSSHLSLFPSAPHLALYPFPLFSPPSLYVFFFLLSLSSPLLIPLCSLPPFISPPSYIGGNSPAILFLLTALDAVHCVTVSIGYSELYCVWYNRSVCWGSPGRILQSVILV